MAKQQGSSTNLIFPALGAFYDFGSEWGYAIIRICAGLWLVPHGAQKLFGWFGGGGITGTAAFFTKIGLVPAVPLVYLVGIVEVLGGILIVIGLLTRPVAILACIELLVAAFYYHFGNGFFVAKGGYEFTLLWAILMFVVIMGGGGKKSVDAAIGKEF